MRGALRVWGVPEAMTRRLAAVVLGSEAPLVLFGAVGAKALADAADARHGTTYLVVGTGLALLAILAAAALQTRWGLALGWLVQLATFASALVLPGMIIVGAVFGVLWIVALVQGAKMDDLTRRHLAAQAGSVTS